MTDIKRNAPKGTTHYRLRRSGGIDYYVKHLNLIYINGKWEISEYPVDQMKNLKVL